jgi:hypothetical protein
MRILFRVSKGCVCVRVCEEEMDKMIN